ncbi:tape measure protein [Acidovorax sp. Root219]|uniref:tape measure protein n=1 Tax=Acidovorax sp. Root219 TaxID=1736493 RepID=UPI0009EADA2C|nr:tape measure protein [Acidovorax sp. Root219]
MSEVKVVLRLERGEYVADLKATGAEHQAFSAQVSTSATAASSSLGAVAGQLKAVGAAAGSATSAASALDQAAKSASQASSAVSVIPQQLQGVAAQFKNSQAAVAGFGRQLDQSRTSLASTTAAAGATGAALLAASRQAEQLGGAVSSSASKATSAVDGLNGNLLRLGQAAAGAFAVNKLTGLADGWTNLTARIGLASQGLGSAQVGLAGVTRIAAEARVDVTGLAETYGVLSKAGAELGFSQQRVLGVTETLSKSMTLSGGSAASASAAMVQFGQGLQAGTLRGDELNSVLEQAPRLAQALAEGLGKPVGALKAMAEQGQITTDAIFVALERMKGKIDSEFAQLPATIGQAFTVISNSLMQTIGVFDQANGISRGFAEGLLVVARNMDTAVVAAGLVATAYIAISRSATVAAAATTALNVATGALGGPIGLVVTALGIAATAWVAWKAAGTSSEKAVQAQVAESHEEIIKRIDAQIAKLRERNRLSGAPLPKSEDQTSLDAAKQYTDAYNRYQSIVNGEGQFANLPAAARSDLLKSAGVAMGQAFQRYTDLADAMTEDAKNKTREAREKFMADYKDQADKMAQALKAYDAEFKGKVSDAQYKADTDAIKAKHANKGTGPSAAKLAISAEIAELEQLQTEAAGIADRAAKQLEAQHQAGLVSEAQYYAQRRQMALNANTDQMAIVELELEAVETSKASAADKAKAREKYGQELAKLAQNELTIESDYQDKLTELQARAAQARMQARRQETQGIEQWMEQQQTAQRENLASIEQRITSLADEQKAADLAAAKNISLAQAIELVTIARLEEQRAAKYYEGSDGWNQATQEIEARRRLAAQIGSNDTTNAARKAGVEAQAELQRATDQYTQGLVNAAMQGGDSLKNYITNMLKRKAWEIVLTPVMEGLGGILATIMGAAGGGGGGGGMGALGTASGAVNLLSAGKTAWQLGSQWLSGSMSSANVAGTVYANATGTGLNGLLATNGAFGTSATSAVNAAAAMAPGTAPALPAGTLAAAAAEGGAATTAPTLISAGLKMVPIIGAIIMGMMASGSAYDQGYRLEDSTIRKSYGLIFPQMNKLTGFFEKIGFSERSANIITGGALIGKIASKLGIQATAHTGAGAIYQNGTVVGGRENYTYDRFNMGDPREYAASAQPAINEVAKAVGGTLDGFFDAFGLKSGFKVQTAFADDISKDGAWGSFRVDDSAGNKVLDWKDTQTSKWAPKEFANGDEGWKQYLDAISDATIDTFKASSKELPAWANRIIAAADTSGDETAKVLEQLLKDVAAYPNAMLEAVGTSRDELVQQFAEGLAKGDATGAGQAVADTLVASVEQSLYTDAAGKIFDTVNQGIVTPMLDAITTGASLSELLSQESIDRVIQRATEQAAALNTLFNDPRFQAALEQIRTGVGGALGSAGAALTYVPKYTQAVKDNTDATKDGTQAQREAADEAKRIADERKGLQDQLDALTMTRVQLLEKERNAIHESNRALWDQVKAAEARVQVAAEAPAVLDRYRTPAQRQALAYEGVSAGLADAGINVSAAALAGASKDQIAGAVMAVHAMGTTSDATRLALLRAAASLSDLKEAAADTALGVLSNAIDAQKTAISEAAQARIDALTKEGQAQQKAHEAASEAVSTLTSMTETLASAVRSLRGQVESTKLQDLAAARRFIADALVAANATGAMPDADALSRALESVTNDDQQRYASAVDWEIAQLDQANQLAQLEQLGMRQKSVAERHLQATEDQAKLLEEEIDAIQQSTDRSLKALDDQLRNAEEQLAVARGMDLSLKNIDKATANFASALAQLAPYQGAPAAVATPGGATKPGATKPRTVLDGPNGAQYDSSSGIFYAGSTGLPYLAADLGAAAIDMVNAGQAKDLYDIAKAHGVTAAMLAEWTGSNTTTINDWAKANGLASLDVGTNYVPHDMLALIHEGERVVPKKYNPDANPGMWTGAQAISARLQQSGGSAAGEAAVSSVITTLGRSVDQLGAGIGSLTDAALQTRDAARRTRDVMEAAARGELKLSVTTS